MADVLETVVTPNPAEGEIITEEGNGEPLKVSPEGTEPTVEELKAELAATKTGMTEQIVNLRKKLKEAEFAKATRTEVPPEDDTESDVERAVRQVLQKDKKAEADRNRISALNAFWASHKDFHPDNDITGLKNEALMASMKRLNTTGSYSTEDILHDLEDAHRLMSITKPTSTKSDLNKIASTTSVPGTPTTSISSKLTPQQEKLRKEKGWSEEKYLKMAAKYPGVVL